MMNLSLKPHEYAMKRGQPVLTRVNPYVRFASGNEGPVIFVQNGQFLYEDGKVVKEADFPDWLGPMLKGLTPEVREEVGLPPLEAKKGPVARPSV